MFDEFKTVNVYTCKVHKDFGVVFHRDKDLLVVKCPVCDMECEFVNSFSVVRLDDANEAVGEATLQVTRLHEEMVGKYNERIGLLEVTVEGLHEALKAADETVEAKKAKLKRLTRLLNRMVNREVSSMCEGCVLNCMYSCPFGGLTGEKNLGVNEKGKV